MKTITQIKKEFQALSIKCEEDMEKVFSFEQEYAGDERAGVRELIEKAEGKRQAYERELTRLYEMKAFERQYQDCEYICGIDEAGRGPLAGPVVAGAVILPKDCDILYINDSKKLSAKKRDELFDEIQEKAIAVGVGVVSSEQIDQINILQATYEAMRLAIKDLGIMPDILLNDAVTIPQVNVPQVPIVKGDAKSVSIAAASIIAKVTRDRMMQVYDEKYPEYGFAAHKGYGSAAHMESIRTYGPCPIHRRTFIKSV